MQRSRPIDVNGRFVGVAVGDIARWRFHATDPALNRLENRLFDDLCQVAREVRIATLQLPRREAGETQPAAAPPVLPSRR